MLHYYPSTASAPEHRLDFFLQVLQVNLRCHVLQLHWLPLYGKFIPDTGSGIGGAFSRIDADEAYPPQNEGIDIQGKFCRSYKAATGDSPAVAGRLDGCRQGVTSNDIHAAGPPLLHHRALRTGRYHVARYNFRRSQITEKLFIGTLPGGGYHPVSRPGQNCHGDGSHAARCAGDEDIAV